MDTKAFDSWTNTTGFPGALDVGSPETAPPPVVGSVPKIHVFSALDHTLFVGMLVVSAIIGIYFAFFAKQKQNTTSEYLMGGRKMGILPVSLSLIASYISGITLLGMPAEIYVYGTQFTTATLGVLGAATGCAFIFMPVFYGLQLSTSYEYLEMRFDRRVRLLGSLLFLVSSFLNIPIVIYLPALAFSQVTGFNIHLITPLVSLVCIFYTSLGGLKAVVWTDALQTVMMFFAMIVVVVIGTASLGGFGNILQRNDDGGRLEFFNFNTDPTVRHTFWNTVIGEIFSWMTYVSVNQGMVQRFLAMPSLRKAHIMIVILTFGCVAITLISCYCGLLIYATYYNCDRLSTKVVRASDQLLPYYVMNVAASLPGLPGLFMAGVFSAALSSMSTGLNSMSGVIYEDFIHPCLKIKISEERASTIMKIICVFIGIVCVGMVFIVQHLGAVIQVSGSLGGITSGPMLAIFALGMLFPWVNSKGALIGGITGMIFMGYISFGQQAAVAKGLLKFEKKPVTTEGCAFLPHDDIFLSSGTSIINTTGVFMDTVTEGSLAGAVAAMTEGEEEQAAYQFRLSYKLYTMIGLSVSIAVGLVVSFLTGPTDPADVHIELLTPVVRPLFAHRCKSGDEAAHWKNRVKKEEEKEMEAEAERDSLLKKETIMLMLDEARDEVKPTR
ncbi:sodium-coupled monocarboxylate transporter 1-like [Ischnura elegans]|uniref:sodium-coupled monocarboxylate transporter 1-like n=1 Tax=Ischnura elegans TaxID=197161 RepID=UPI001ED897AB|nr:sodium-coupled monocarboxylate transporter 1-like [Ischnura elegans]